MNFLPKYYCFQANNKDLVKFLLDLPDVPPALLLPTHRLLQGLVADAGQCGSDLVGSQVQLACLSAASSTAANKLGAGIKNILNRFA